MLSLSSSQIEPATFLPSSFREHYPVKNSFNEDLYGGSLDALPSFERKPTVVDFKWSNGRAHPDMIIQLAAYRNLLIEHLGTAPALRLVILSKDGPPASELVPEEAKLAAANQVSSSLPAIHELRGPMDGQHPHLACP